MSETPERHVVVVGGGTAGLSTAWRLLCDPELGAKTPTCEADPVLSETALKAGRSRLTVTVLESRGRLGGNIHSEEDGGFIVEWGPNGFLDNAPETPRLCRLLGIEHRLLPALDAAGKRFLYVRGKLRSIPLSPVAFLLSDLLTIRGRLRVLTEPFQPARPDPDESVFAFAARRIGEEAARTLVDAMVSGVYGGNARDLTLVSAFPKMHALEKEYGGLVKGMIGKMKERRRERRLAAKAAAQVRGPLAGRRAEPDGRGAASDGRGDPETRRAAQSGPAGPGGVLTSFDRGLEVLIEELARALAASGRCSIRLNSSAHSVIPPAEQHGRWRVRLGDESEITADAVVLAIPSCHGGALVRGFDEGLCATLQSIPDAPLVVVGLAFSKSDLPYPLDGFGYLIPRGEGPRILGVLWDSCIYTNRAPADMVLLRAMVGGAHDPAAFDLSDDEVVSQVKADLRTTLGFGAEPRRVWILRHKHGIPQYTLGHPQRLTQVEAAEGRWPGLYFTGNSYRGISVNHVVERSLPLAREVWGRVMDNRPFSKPRLVRSD